MLKSFFGMIFWEFPDEIFMNRLSEIGEKMIFKGFIF